MNRLLAVLMIALLACGNVFPHSLGKGDAPSDDAAPPHVHIGTASHSHQGHLHGHPHHQHQHQHQHQAGGQSDGSDASENELPVDHDSDAVYLSSGQPFLHISAGSTMNIQLDCIGLVAESYSSLAGRSAPHPIGPAVLTRIGPPLFLLHAALRL